jgi:hypothetical protein
MGFGETLLLMSLKISLAVSIEPIYIAMNCLTCESILDLLVEYLIYMHSSS